jgi:hypothetical protein
MSKDSTINFKISHVHISGPYCILKENLVVWTMRDKDDENKEEMVPFFNVASRNFERDLDILKKYCINLNNEHILKMHIYLAKGLRWQQDGGCMISYLSQTLRKRSFN